MPRPWTVDFRQHPRHQRLPNLNNPTPEIRCIDSLCFAVNPMLPSDLAAGAGRIPPCMAPPLRCSSLAPLVPPSSRTGDVSNARLPMRLIVGISLILLGVGSLSCRLEGMAGSATSSPPALDWVRTADGWERPVQWHKTVPHQPRLHPVVVAAGQILASVLALVAFGREKDQGKDSKVRSVRTVIRRPAISARASTNSNVNSRRS